MGIRDARSFFVTSPGKIKHVFVLDNLCSIRKRKGLVPTLEILSRIRDLLWEADSECPNAFRQSSK